MADMSVEDYRQRARELRAAGKNDEALELLNEAIAKCADARLYFSRGVQFELIDQPERAIADLSTAIQLDPSNTKYLMNRASILSSVLHQDAEALSDFVKVLQLDPNNSEAHRECCLILLLLGSPFNAWGHAAAAMRLAPDDAMTYFCVGECLMSLGKYDEAEKAFMQAVAMDPTKDYCADALNRAREKMLAKKNNL